jgi:Tfp pilus assembly protein PilV
MLRTMKKRLSGVTLFEVLLVLFVAAFIAAAVATIYSKVTLTFKQNQLQNGVQQLAANITATYSSGGTADYTSLDTDHVIAGGLAPEDMYDSNKKPITPFSSTAGWDVAGTTSYYTIILKNIPAGACSTLYQPLSKISTHQSMEVGGTAIDSPSKAITSCAGDPKTITLYIN